MSVIRVIFRIDEICKKYDKYDIDSQRELNAYGDDAFARLFAAFESEIESTLQKAEIASTDKDGASTAALHAEIRRKKTRLMDEVPKLRKLAQKKVKGLSKEELAVCEDLVLTLPERIEAIPDGTMAAAKRGGRVLSTSVQHIKFDSDGNFDSERYHQTEESRQFRDEYEMRKLKQDEGLDIIAEGLDTLKNLTCDMNEELDRQVPLMDEIDTKTDKVASEIQNTNVRLKENLIKMRSSRNFCIDIVLLCVLLGIISYIYNVLR